MNFFIGSFAISQEGNDFSLSSSKTIDAQRDYLQNNTSGLGTFLFTVIIMFPTLIITAIINILVVIGTGFIYMPVIINILFITPLTFLIVYDYIIPIFRGN